MIRKCLVYTILFSMMLHCASRLKLVDTIYKNRNQIAYSIGLIAEIPIAMCDGKYDFGRGIVVNEQEHQTSLPTTLSIAQEINLFHSLFNLTIIPRFVKIADTIWGSYTSKEYTSPAALIFHPPSLIS